MQRQKKNKKQKNLPPADIVPNRTTKQNANVQIQRKKERMNERKKDLPSVDIVPNRTTKHNISATFMFAVSPLRLPQIQKQC